MHIYIPPIQSKSSCDATSLALLLVDGCGSFCGTDVDVTLLLIDKSFPEFRPNKSNAILLQALAEGYITVAEVKNIRESALCKKS